MRDSDEYSARLEKIENDVRGVRNGQQALREHLDENIDQIKIMIQDAQEGQPPSVQHWSVLLLATSNVVIALIVAIFLFEYYVLR